MKKLAVWCLLTVIMWGVNIVRMCCSVFKLRDYKGWFGAYEGGCCTCWIALVERRKDLRNTLCYLLALLTPPNQLRLYFDSLSDNESLHSFRRAMFVRSRHFPIDELCPSSDSRLGALRRWIKWHSKLAYLYHSDRHGTTPPTMRLKEYLGCQRFPDVAVADLFELMQTNRIPVFLSEVIIAECLSRLERDIQMGLGNHALAEFLIFTSESEWVGWNALKERCLLIAMARIEAGRGSDEENEKLTHAVRVANPFRATTSKVVDIPKVLTDSGETKPHPSEKYFP